MTWEDLLQQDGQAAPWLPWRVGSRWVLVRWQLWSWEEPHPWNLGAAWQGMSVGGRGHCVLGQAQEKVTKTWWAHLVGGMLALCAPDSQCELWQHISQYGHWTPVAPVLEAGGSEFKVTLNYVSSSKAILGWMRPYFKPRTKQHKKMLTNEGLCRTFRFSGATANSKHCA